MRDSKCLGRFKKELVQEPETVNENENDDVHRYVVHLDMSFEEFDRIMRDPKGVLVFE